MTGTTGPGPAGRVPMGSRSCCYGAQRWGRPGQPLAGGWLTLLCIHSSDKQSRRIRRGLAQRPVHRETALSWHVQEGGPESGPHAMCPPQVTEQGGHIGLSRKRSLCPGTSQSQAWRRPEAGNDQGTGRAWNPLPSGHNGNATAKPLTGFALPVADAKNQ